MSASIKDVAKAAGVSASTVSRALTDNPRISPKTAARVKRAAEELHYAASALGRGLVTGKTKTIGVVVTAITDPFVGEVVSGVEDAAMLTRPASLPARWAGERKSRRPPVLRSPISDQTTTSAQTLP